MPGTPHILAVSLSRPGPGSLVGPLVDPLFCSHNWWMKGINCIGTELWLSRQAKQPVENVVSGGSLKRNVT